MSTKLNERYRVPVGQKVMTKSVIDKYEEYVKTLVETGKPFSPDYLLLSKILEKGLEYYFSEPTKHPMFDG